MRFLALQWVETEKKVGAFRTVWAIGIDMYTLMCIKLMTNKSLLYKKVKKIKFKN